MKEPEMYQTADGKARIETNEFNQAWLESDTIKEVKQ